MSSYAGVRHWSSWTWSGALKWSGFSAHPVISAVYIYISLFATNAEKYTDRNIEIKKENNKKTSTYTSTYFDSA